MQSQKAYWDKVAGEKTFTHPINYTWFDILVPKTARILDYGCGYGRAMGDLVSHGYMDLVGMDFSSAMVERARQTYPSMDVRVIESLPIQEPDCSFDAVMLFAVLTSIPDEKQQDAVMHEIRRLLRRGGILFMSDVPLQEDSRSVSRYTRDASEFGHYGIVRTDDGVVVRHHDEARMQALLQGFEPLHLAKVSLNTMNGNPATAVQSIARRGA